MSDQSTIAPEASILRVRKQERARALNHISNVVGGCLYKVLEEQRQHAVADGFTADEVDRALGSALVEHLLYIEDRTGPLYAEEYPDCD